MQISLEPLNESEHSMTGQGTELFISLVIII